tara:strand:- start:131 stop:364 length:234 start_codon:yes stop_codon:yes gene_type:complete
MNILLLASTATGSAIGLAVGMYLHYISYHKPFLEAYYRISANNMELVKQMVAMKKQGFVPQFELEQPKKVDLTLREF